MLPHLLGASDGRKMIRLVEKILVSDRWNSFDRFHETTGTLVTAYERAGARAEVHRIPTGGPIGGGRWVIHEAADVYAATAEVVRPLRWKICDWRQNPWHLVQWSAATPSEGLTGELVVLDTREEIENAPAWRVAGRIVLTKLDPRGNLKRLTDKGALGLLSDRPVPGLPSAVPWSKFGWGGPPIDCGAMHLVGFSLGEALGAKLRALLQKHGKLTLRLRVDTRRYVGEHDLVSGLIVGRDDPQDEVWVLAHSAEPGANDNASGVAVCVEIARLVEGLIARGVLPRPRRTVRLLSGYECYSFFHFLEHGRRLQPPLAGACVDDAGADPRQCDGLIGWHESVGSSAGFVEHVGEAVLREALRRRPVYRFIRRPFVSTLDTLIGDPKYGFPCPWLTTSRRRDMSRLSHYHTSADTPDTLSARGMEVAAAAMAAYVYQLADAGAPELLDWADAETRGALAEVSCGGDRAALAAARHGRSIERLHRWMWGGDRGEILSHLDQCSRQVREAAAGAVRARPPKALSAGARLVPHRTALLTPMMENVPQSLAGAIWKSGLRPWHLYWADGKRNLGEIAEAARWEDGERPSPEGVESFFRAHEQLGYVKLVSPGEMFSRRRIEADLRALGLHGGMDVMVHSALSKVGYVRGGAEAVIDAMLAVIGPSGTLLAPSFNHSQAQVYNAMTTPTTNGAIPDALWRRPQAVRSDHPSHAVAAIGPRAEDYCRGHIEAGIWSADSPIGRLIRGGGYILSIGVTHGNTTAYHVGEMSLPCPCLDAFASRDRVVMPDGTVRVVPGLAWRVRGCPVPTRKLDEELTRRRFQRRGKVGMADATLVLARHVYEARRRHIRGVCPTCDVPFEVRRPK
jgi:aminoglycoside 3-N-acetyltransferase